MIVYVAEPGSPFQASLVKFLLRYPQQTVDMFLDENKIGDHQWNRCFLVSTDRAREENQKERSTSIVREAAACFVSRRVSADAQEAGLRALLPRDSAVQPGPSHQPRLWLCAGT